MKVVTRRIVIVTQFYNNFDPIARERNLFYSVILSAVLPDFGPALQTEQHQV